ncbi:MAG TPA: DUF4112 domain-containing protein [Longimicrobiales bacterium]
MASALTGLRRLTWLLDDVVRIPGTRLRFGLDPIIGLLPGGGDLAGALLAGYALVVAARLGAPPSVLLRMAGNIAVDTVVGTIPVLGDLFDFGWKSNRRNLNLLERYLADPRRATRSSRLVLLAILLLLLAVCVGAGLLGYLLVRWLVHLVH